MTLKEEFKKIYTNRPTREERKAARAAAAPTEKRRAYPKDNKYKIALIVMGIFEVVFLCALVLVDALPNDLTFILVAMTLGLVVLTSMLFASRYKWKRIVGIVLAVLFVLISSMTTGFMTSTYAMLNKISSAGLNATGPKSDPVDVTREPFNIYITGIDQWEKDKGMDLERSDVNMIVTINPVTKKILMTSIPRDSYVKLHTAQAMDKLTHTGIYGVDETLNTVEDWLDVDINYYVKMNFSGARDIINAIGGIKVYSPVDFESDLKGYKYHKGWNKLSGKEALYFARERHAFEGQDSQRVENQQRVMEAVIKKMTSSPTLLMNYGDVMDAAGNNVETNMSAKEMQALVKMQVSDLASWDMESQKIEGEYDQDYVASLTQSQKFDVYRPNEKSVKKCMKGVEEIQNPSKAELEEARRSRSKSFFVNLIKNSSKDDKSDKSDKDKK